MDADVVTIELPTTVYTDLEALAMEEQTSPAELIARLVTNTRRRSNATDTPDPVFELIGAYSSERGLIDGIPVSEDPDLYLAAEAWGTQANGLHAWEIAPARYMQGANGQPVRRRSDEDA